MPRKDSIFLRVKEAIEKDIEKAGQAGETGLKSEVFYSESLQVSRMTVRKAVDELVRQGRLKRVPGKGLELPGAQDGNPDQPRYKRLAFVIRFDRDDDFFSRMVLACAQAANSRGYSYNIYNISEMRDSDIFAAIFGTEIDGVLFTYYSHEKNVGNFELVTGKQVPVVMVDNLPPEGDYPFVLSDDEKGGFLACSHLLDKGRTRILFITDEVEEHSQKMRLAGYRKALRQRGLPQDSIVIWQTDSQEALEAFIRKEYGEGRGFDAVGGAADSFVIQVYPMLRSMGIRVPQQVSLMGYGNSVEGRLLEVPLNTIEMPVFEMGVQACRMLIDYLEGKSTLDKRVLDVKLIDREKEC